MTDQPTGNLSDDFQDIRDAVRTSLIVAILTERGPLTTEELFVEFNARLPVVLEGLWLELATTIQAVRPEWTREMVIAQLHEELTRRIEEFQHQHGAE